MGKHSHSSESHAGHDHGIAGANEKALLIALVLTASFMGAEVVAGFAFNSLALLSDAAHMATDTAALGIALLAIRVGRRAPDSKRSFGYGRLETLAAAFNALMLLAVAAFVLVEAARRIREPVEVQTWGMLIVASLGLAVNLIAMRVLRGKSESSLNVKGAYLEVWADMIGSVGVIIGAGLVKFTGWNWIDIVIAVAIGLWIVPRSWLLLKDGLHILLEGTPENIDLAKVRTTLLAVNGVVEVHDLHVWSIGPQTPALAAHIIISDPAQLGPVLRQAGAMLKDRFGIEHSTVQCEPSREAKAHAQLHL